MSPRVHTIEAGIFCADISTSTAVPTSGGRTTIAIRPPADMFLTLISCW